MDNKRGAVFLYALGSISFLWGSASYFLIRKIYGSDGASAFLQVFFFTVLDLIALIVFFWKVFFSRLSGLGKKVDLALWFSFKLVCLAFLAITLKRLTNAPFAAILLGVGFIGVGPIGAGITCKAIVKDKI